MATYWIQNERGNYHSVLQMEKLSHWEVKWLAQGQKKPLSLLCSSPYSLLFLLIYYLGWQEPLKDNYFLLHTCIAGSFSQFGFDIKTIKARLFFVCFVLLCFFSFIYIFYSLFLLSLLLKKLVCSFRVTKPVEMNWNTGSLLHYVFKSKSISMETLL